MENKNKHTPGPWHVNPDYFDNPTGKNKSIMFKAGPTTFKSVARVIPSDSDARLISAAPELLAALGWAMLHLEANKKYLKACPDKCYWDMARAAIAKAEGRE